MQPNGAISITIVLLLLLAIQRQQTQLFGFILMTERWLNEHNRLLLAAALLHSLENQYNWVAIGLITVFDAILTSRQTRPK